MLLSPRALAAATIYLKAWSNKEPISDTNHLPPVPSSVDEIYETHEAMIYLAPRLAPFLNGLAGYKMGGVGLVTGQPCFFAPLFREFVMTSPREPSMTQINCIMLEAEIGFIMKSDIPPRESSHPYDPKDLIPFIESIVCCTELCGIRATGDALQNMPIMSKLADGLMTGGVYMGHPRRLFDLGKENNLGKMLKGVKTQIFVNDVIMDSGSGAKCPMGGPLESLAWLVNRLISGGKMLKKGQLVISGMTSKVPKADFKVGDEITVTFEGLDEKLNFSFGV